MSSKARTKGMENAKQHIIKKCEWKEAKMTDYIEIFLWSVYFEEESDINFSFSKCKYTC